MEAMKTKPRFPASLREQVLAKVRLALESEDALAWAYVVGSVGRGEDFGDVDVAVHAADDASLAWRDLGRLSRRIAGAIAVPGLEVDVLSIDAFPLPYLIDALADGVVVLDRDPEARARWEAEQTLRWLDFEPVWREQANLRKQAGRT
jgi:predicted nucleotidyltransferase